MTIDRPIEDVFAFVADVSTMDEWVVGMADTRLVSGEGGEVGDVYESQYTYGGSTTPIELTITAIESPTRVAMESTEGPFPSRANSNSSARVSGCT